MGQPQEEKPEPLRIKAIERPRIGHARREFLRCNLRSRADRPLPSVDERARICAVTCANEECSRASAVAESAAVPRSRDIAEENTPVAVVYFRTSAVLDAVPRSPPSVRRYLSVLGDESLPRLSIDSN
jgi:hypothetical protein